MPLSRRETIYKKSSTVGAATATNITASANNSTDETVYPTFIDGATGTQGIETDTGLTYNPSTGVITTTSVTGNLTGNVTGNTSGTAATVTGGTQASITAAANLVTVGALNSGSITSGFTSIDVGSGAITTTGAISGATIDATTDFTIGTTVITDDVITFTPTASDTITMTAATNGAFSLVTVDNAAAAANIQITADGTVDIDSAGVLTLDSGAAINIEPAAGSAILLDGTISVDAGVITGATSITSSAFVGALTGNASGLSATLAVASGGTGATSLTDKAVLISQDTGTDTVGSVALTTSGQLIIGGSSGPAAATLTAGSNITITNGDGSITIAASGGGGTPTAITVADTTDTSSYVALFESATGDLGPKTDAGITYNAGTGILTATGFAGPLTGNVTGNTSGTAATVTTAAQTNITSLGTLTTLTVDSVIINGTNIGHTSDTDSMAIASDGVVTFSQIPVLPANSIDSDHYVDGSIDNAHIADDAIDSEHYAAGSIDTAHIADNQITLAKLAGGTDGNIISYDASGDPVAIATGSDGQVLTSTGAGSPPAFEALPASSGVAADDISVGDAAVLLTTSSGNITVDAAANDSDIIFKGTDGAADTTFLTIDGSAAGLATFNAGATLGGNLIIPDDGNIGSASDTNSIAISSAGVVTMDQIPVFSAGINVSGGTIAGTLATVAQGNITSLGTLTALTVDDVVIDGKVVTMTGSSGDTAVFTVGTNGTLSIVTTDTAAAAANLQITADGTVDIDSAGVLTLDSGAAINIEPAAGSAILLDGTISVDAGVVTGATSITSTAFVGDITGDVTGDASGTAAIATSITAVANNSTDETVYPAFVDGATGTQGIETDTGLTYNPSSGILTTTQLTGNVVGDVTGDVTGTADVATLGTNVTVVANNSTDETVYLTFVDGATGTQGIETDTGLTYNPSSGLLTATTFSGSIATATESTNVTVVANNSTDETVYPAFVDGATGTQGIETDTGLTYNPSTGVLTTTSVTGNLTGNVTGNTSGTAATVTTAAQTNITSLGTLTALTVDDVAIDGKVITMTGSSSDTAVLTVATNGALSLVTTDAAAAAANIQITADGTVDIDSAGVLTLDSGAAINIEPAAGSAILLDGTISVDAGVVTGATSITSTAFVGALTGNASGTAATVTTAAQTNITSLGTLTALTVDDVVIDGKVVTMTGSSSDTAVFTAGTNGTLSIVTTDAAAAAANIQITADGTVDIDSAGVLTLDSGAAINIEPASGSAILLDGTISVDAGVVTGATSITSTAFVGDITGDVTGNASGTAATVTTAAQTNITSLGTLTALTVDDVAINGKVITMTGSSSDTAVITAGTNGTLSIVTTDAAAAAANIQITADGTVDIDSAGVLTLDSGAAINIEPASGSAILLDGTISIDAGVVTGATSITSTAFVGDITGDVTGTADVATVATTVTITDNESTSENNAVIFTAGGDLAGGNLGLESDGDLTYNPSTGRLTATQLAGTLQTASQTAITAVGTIGTGVWQGTAVASGYIAADAITGAKIADNAIDSEHYTDGSIDNAHIADDAIDSEHYADGSIDNAHIADDAIDSEHYAAGSIDTAHIGDLQVTTAKIAADAITAAKIADDAIDSEHYTDGSIDNAHIADDAIDSEHYAAGSIDTAHIADNQITLAKLAGGTDGNIISYDASGDPVAIATGSDGQVLTSAGAGAPPVFEDAGGGGPDQANQAAIEAETNEDTYAPPDLLKHMPGAAKVWLNWEQDGANSIIDSYNVTSVTDGGATGDSDILWATDFSNATYALSGISEGVAWSPRDMQYKSGTKIAGGVTIFVIGTGGTGYADSGNLCIVGFGDQ